MTNRERFYKSHGIPLSQSLSLEEIAKVSGFPLGLLRKVYERGRGAWKSNPESVRLKGRYTKDATAPRSAKLSAEQWGYGRVFSFLMMNPGTFYGADRDLAVQYGLLPQRQGDGIQLRQSVDEASETKSTARSTD
jgi:hypothetical protein